MKTYQGGCHCGAVRYEVGLDLSQPVYDCNCSLCQMRGGLLSFTPAEHFKLLSGEGRTTTYRFHKKAIDHLFCTTCGVASFSRGKKPSGEAMICVNTRCLDGIDLGNLEVKQVDGRSF